QMLLVDKRYQRRSQTICDEHTRECIRNRQLWLKRNSNENSRRFCVDSSNRFSSISSNNSSSNHKSIIPSHDLQPSRRPSLRTPLLKNGFPGSFSKCDRTVSPALK